MRNRKNTWTFDTLDTGDTQAIRDRVFSDPNYIHERDFVGDTPLMTAVDFCNLDLVQFLLKHGADPNADADDGYTCLLSAIESEDEASLTILTELISAGADVNQTGINGWAPLHMAASRGHIDKVRILIEAGANVNHRKDIDGSETPLMEAAYSGRAEVVQFLLDHGADPSMRDTMMDRTSLEIAEYAAKGPDPDVVDILKSENMRMNYDDLFGDMEMTAEELEILKASVKNVDMAKSYIDAASQNVSKGNHAEVIRILKLKLI